jgi:LPS-assembly protein
MTSRVKRVTAAALSSAAMSVLCFALASPGLAQNDLTPQEPILLEAPEINYDSKNGIVTAKGGVEVSTGGRVMRADEITYNQVTRVVTAKGNVSITEPDGDVAFADSVELTDDLRDGVIQQLAIRLADDSKLAASEGRRTAGTITELRNAVFSPCKVCPEDPDPLWQIKAARIIHDKAAQTISYEDATFEIFGTPLITVPYFTHADPTIKRKSGFLVPSVGNSTDLGYFIEVPYYWAPAQNYDFTFAPFITTDESTVLKGEYRHRFNNGDYWFQGSATVLEVKDTAGHGTDEHTTASHLFGNGRFEIDPIWRYGFDVQLTSSDTYMERYEISQLDRLTTDAFIEGIHNRNYAAATGYFFQGLRETDRPGTTPFVLPLAEISYYMPRRVAGGQIRFDGNLMVLQRTDGADSRRLSAAAEWIRPYTASTGDVITFFASLRGDVYHTSDVVGVGDDEFVGRALPLAGVDYRWPWVKPGLDASYVIEPIAQLLLSPNGGNPAEIPNEDSASFEFDDINLFNAQKFPGLDRWESGVRANVGLRAAAYLNQGGLIELLVGQNFRLEEDSAFPPDSGLGDQASDYVGRLTVNPDKHLAFTHRFRLDRDDLSARRNEIYLDANYKHFDLNASYVRLSQNAALTGVNRREEIKTEGALHITDHWSVIAGARRDLEADEMIESKAGVAYEDECSVFEVSYRRRFIRDRDIEPSSAIVFKVRLKALGDDEYDND